MKYFQKLLYLPINYFNLLSGQALNAGTEVTAAIKHTKRKLAFALGYGAKQT